MDIQKINDGIKTIAEYMGYVYFERNVLLDNSEIGGIYEKVDIYSKVPIETYAPEDELEKYFKLIPNPDYLNYENPKWNPEIKHLCWGTVNCGQYLINPKYNESWDLLMPVFKKLMKDLKETSGLHKHFLSVATINLHYDSKETIKRIFGAIEHLEISDVFERIVEAIKEFNLLNCDCGYESDNNGICTGCKKKKNKP